MRKWRDLRNYILEDLPDPRHFVLHTQLALRTHFPCTHGMDAGDPWRDAKVPPHLCPTLSLSSQHSPFDGDPMSGLESKCQSSSGKQQSDERQRADQCR